MEKSVELIRYLKEERLLKCLYVTGKLFQGAIIRYVAYTLTFNRQIQCSFNVG